MSFFNEVKVLDEGGTLISGTNPFDVQEVDRTSEIIDIHLTRQLDTITLRSDFSDGDRVIEVTTTGSTPAVGDTVCLKQGTAFLQSYIVSVAAVAGNDYDLTLEWKSDFDFTVAGIGSATLRSEDMNVDGSSTEVEFSASPSGLQSGCEWRITRFMFVINDNAAMDDSKFGALTALTNGVYFRVENGTTKNIFCARSNGDLASHMYDVEYVDATLGPAGEYGLRGRRTFGTSGKNGSVIRLTADGSDAFKCIIQDNLTGLTKFNVIIQGYVLT
jgi:hypothetical protein